MLTSCLWVSSALKEFDFRRISAPDGIDNNNRNSSLILCVFYVRQERVIFTLSHGECLQQLCCSHGFSGHESLYVTYMSAPSWFYITLSNSTQSHVTAEPHAAKLASLRPTRYLFTETVNVFNRYVAHMAWERVHGSPDSVVIT